MRRDVVWKPTRLLETIVVLTALMLSLSAATPQPVRVRRIAFLGFGTAPNSVAEAFRHALLTRGWVEGHNLAIEWRWTEGNLDQFATLVAEVLRLQVEVLVVPNATTAQIAYEATKTIPIVVVRGGSLATSPLIARLARPVGNITGVATLNPEVGTKRLALLKEALPEVTRVAVLRGLAPQTQELSALEVAARSLGVELHLEEVHDPKQFESAFAAMVRAQTQALFVFGDPFFFPYRQRIADLAAQQHLPSMCAGRAYVEAGCLMSYSASERESGG